MCWVLFSRKGRLVRDLRVVYFCLLFENCSYENLPRPNCEISMNLLVPGAGIEPARPCSRGILSPLRLPVSPPGHKEDWRLASILNGRCSRLHLLVFPTSSSASYLQTYSARTADSETLASAPTLPHSETMPDAVGGRTGVRGHRALTVLSFRATQSA